MNTKQCPFCGEEILEVAKKCKHCGEWLDKATATVHKKMTECPFCAEEIEDGLDVCPVCKESIAKKQENTFRENIHSANKPNYELLSWMCNIAIVCEIISGIQSIGLNTKGTSGPFVSIANFIPEWVILTCCGVLFVYLLTGLRKHYMMTHANQPIPFIALICTLIAFYSIAIIVEMIPDSDEVLTKEGYIVGLLIMFPLLSPMLILEFIVGFKLKDRLKEASSVGTMMMIHAFVPMIVVIVGMAYSVNNTLPWWATVISSGITIIFYWILKEFFDKQAKEIS